MPSNLLPKKRPVTSRDQTHLFIDICKYRPMIDLQLIVVIYNLHREEIPYLYPLAGVIRAEFHAHSTVPVQLLAELSQLYLFVFFLTILPQIYRNIRTGFYRVIFPALPTMHKGRQITHEAPLSSMHRDF